MFQSEDSTEVWKTIWLSTLGVFCSAHHLILSCHMTKEEARGTSDKSLLLRTAPILHELLKTSKVTFEAWTWRSFLKTGIIKSFFLCTRQRPKNKSALRFGAVWGFAAVFVRCQALSTLVASGRLSGRSDHSKPSAPYFRSLGLTSETFHGRLGLRFAYPAMHM